MVVELPNCLIGVVKSSHAPSLTFCACAVLQSGTSLALANVGVFSSAANFRMSMIAGIAGEK